MTNNDISVSLNLYIETSRDGEISSHFTFLTMSDKDRQERIEKILPPRKGNKAVIYTNISPTPPKGAGKPVITGLTEIPFAYD